MDVTFFNSPSELREWLAQHHDTANAVMVGFYKKQSGNGGITYPEALDEALCFGWIDGVRKTLDGGSYTIRFTPRKPRSIWSAVNIKRVGELIALGRMQPAGLKAFEGRDAARSRLYSFENRPQVLEGEYEERLRANEQAWAFFQAQPPSYRRVAVWWVMSAKQEETRQRRLATLIADSEQGRRLAAVTYTRKT